MDLKQIKVFEEYGGDMDEVFDALLDDASEQISRKVADKLLSLDSWEEILEYCEEIGVEPSYAEDRFHDLKSELLEQEIESIKHDCSYYPENACYYDNKIKQAYKDLG